MLIYIYINIYIYIYLQRECHSVLAKLHLFMSLYVTSSYSTWIFCRGVQALQLIFLAAFGVVD